MRDFRETGSLENRESEVRDLTPEEIAEILEESRLLTKEECLQI